jgi:hypothetical protein
MPGDGRDRAGVTGNNVPRNKSLNVRETTDSIVIILIYGHWHRSFRMHMEFFIHRGQLFQFRVAASVTNGLPQEDIVLQRNFFQRGGIKAGFS